MISIQKVKSPSYLGHRQNNQIQENKSGKTKTTNNPLPWKQISRSCANTKHFCSLGGSWVEVFESSSHQVKASSDEYLDIASFAERSSFGRDARFNRERRLGLVRQH